MGAGVTKGIGGPSGEVSFEGACLPFVGLSTTQLRELRRSFGEYAQGYRVEVDVYAFLESAWRKFAASPTPDEPRPALLALDFSADGSFLRAAPEVGGDALAYFAAPSTAADEPPPEDDADGDASPKKKKKEEKKEPVVKDILSAAADDVAAVDWATKACAAADFLDALQGSVEPLPEEEDDEDDEDAPKKPKVEPPPTALPKAAGVRVSLRRPDDAKNAAAPLCHAVLAPLVAKATPSLMLTTGAGDGVLAQWSLHLAPEVPEEA